VPRVYLVGFMGCGKSSVGAALAASLDRRFVDLDTVLEERFGASIAEVFEVNGEAAFREAETEALRWTTTLDAAVVATGGGAFCSVRNRRLMHAADAVSVFVDVPWPVIEDRLSGGNSDRPLFVSVESARRLYQGRKPHYEKATVTARLSGREPIEDVVQMVCELLAEVACAT
jgi:shikimate kinase